jgi:2-phosphoglycerate kinase
MKNKQKHTVYFIGGPGRVGKTTVAGEILRRKHLVVIQSDAIRAGIRKVLIDESYVNIDEVSFKGKARFRRPGDLRTHEVAFARTRMTDDELTWIGILGLLEGYDRKNRFDVLVEGIVVTPEQIHRLKLKNLVTRAAFIGYTNESHLASILAYPKKEKDWVYKSIQEHGGSDAHLKPWARQEMAKSASMKKLAKKFGYKYFELSDQPFKKTIKAVVDYLIEK